MTKLRIGERRRRCPASYGAHCADPLVFQALPGGGDTGVAEVETPVRLAGIRFHARVVP